MSLRRTIWIGGDWEEYTSWERGSNIGQVKRGNL
jgi:hypothetical protein